MHDFLFFIAATGHAERADACCAKRRTVLRTNGFIFAQGGLYPCARNIRLVRRFCNPLRLNALCESCAAAVLTGKIESAPAFF